MKKVIFTLLALVFVSSLCFAEQASTPAIKTSPVVPETETVVPETETAVLETETAVLEPKPAVSETETAVPGAETFVPETETFVPETEPIVPETKTFTGKVYSVSLGDAKKGTKSVITVVGDNGQKLIFAVEAGTPMTELDGKPIALSYIQKDSKVTIQYTTEADNTNKVRSIKLNKLL